jgi:hypothetical protein
MKIRITITGYLEVEFERDSKQADYPVSNDAIAFFKQCVECAAAEARKLQLPPATAPAT